MLICSLANWKLENCPAGKLEISWRFQSGPEGIN
jgi:hypothetical protein